MPKVEKQIQNSIEHYLKVKRVFFWKNNTGALKTDHGGFIRFGAVGSPDICVVHDGKFYGLEVKQPSGKQSPGQIEFEKGLVAAGGLYYIVTSIDDVQRIGL